MATNVVRETESSAVSDLIRLLVLSCTQCQVSLIHELSMPFTFNPGKMLAWSLKKHQKASLGTFNT